MKAMIGLAWPSIFLNVSLRVDFSVVDMLLWSSFSSGAIEYVLCFTMYAYDLFYNPRMDRFKDGRSRCVMASDWFFIRVLIGVAKDRRLTTRRNAGFVKFEILSPQETAQKMIPFFFSQPTILCFKTTWALFEHDHIHAENSSSNTKRIPVSTCCDSRENCENFVPLLAYWHRPIPTYEQFKIFTERRTCKMEDSFSRWRFIESNVEGRIALPCDRK